MEELEEYDILEYPKYCINKNGEVFSKEKVISKVCNGTECLQTYKKKKLVVDVSSLYKRVRLYNEKGSKSVLIHRILGQLFIPNPGNKPQVNHKDGNKLNNSLENLEWCSQSENTLHAYDNKLLIPKGNRKGFTGKHVKNSISVDMYDLNNNYIKTYESLALASKDGYYSQTILKCIRNEKDTYKSKIFKLSEK